VPEFDQRRVIQGVDFGGQYCARFIVRIVLIVLFHSCSCQCLILFTLCGPIELFLSCVTSLSSMSTGMVIWTDKHYGQCLCRFYSFQQ
jgi:hypothetical protein